MRIITCNLNGIRSAARKGFFGWLGKQDADVVCVQELKAQEDDLTGEMRFPPGYRGYFQFAKKKGYSGVGIYCRREPDRVDIGLGWREADDEGRYVEAAFGKLRVASIYLPSGSHSEERQAAKFRFLEAFEPVLAAKRRSRSSFVIAGDWNIAHKEIDLKNWRSNQQNSGFLPEERAYLDRVFASGGYVDAFRLVDSRPEQYTWWSNRGQSWAKNVGWRIDYQVISPALASRVQRAAIFKDARFSDHAPLSIDYDGIDI